MSKGKTGKSVGKEKTEDRYKKGVPETKIGRKPGLKVYSKILSKMQKEDAAIEIIKENTQNLSII